MAQKYLKRKIENKLLQLVQRPETIGIRGARQTGKTTLLRIIESKIAGNRAFINFDLVENRRALEENPLDFVKRFKKEGKLFLFLDEIQKVKEAGEKLKIIYDKFKELKIFFSGSSSLELKSNVLPALVGRLFLFELYTFDFGEFLSCRDKGLERLYQEKHQSLKDFLEKGKEIPRPSFTQDFLSFWKDYAVFGGYPEVVKTENEEEKKLILKNIFNLYLEKDIVNFFQITETSKFEDFLKALSFITGNLLIVSSLSNKLKISHKKAEEFLEILKHTYVISFLTPFNKNMVTEIKKAPKIYFLDLGLRNAVINNFLDFKDRSDAGQLIENFVFRQLLSDFEDYKINFWRTTGKAEVDFILSRGEEIIPVEVKLNKEALGKSFYSFLNAYHPGKAVIVTLDQFQKEKINGTIVYWLPVFYF